MMNALFPPYVLSIFLNSLMLLTDHKLLENRPASESLFENSIVSQRGAGYGFRVAVILESNIVLSTNMGTPFLIPNSRSVPGPIQFLVDLSAYFSPLQELPDVEWRIPAKLK